MRARLRGGASSTGRSCRKPCQLNFLKGQTIVLTETYLVTAYASCQTGWGAGLMHPGRVRSPTPTELLRQNRRGTRTSTD